MNADMTPSHNIDEGYFVGDYEGDPYGEFFNSIQGALADANEFGGEIFPVLKLDVGFPWGGGFSVLTTVELAEFN